MDDKESLYIEGWALDELASGEGHGSNRVGVVLDDGVDEASRIRHFYVRNCGKRRPSVATIEHC